MSDAEIGRLYTDFYPRSKFNVELHGSRTVNSNRRTSWLKGEDANAYAWVPKNVTVLDIGCGFGEAVGYHRERGCDAYGVEMDRNTINAIDHYNYNIQIGLFDKNNYTLKSFDYVTLDQVIEHLKDPVKQLNDIHEVLKPEGKLIISTPNYYAFMRRILGKKWLH